MKLRNLVVLLPVLLACEPKKANSRYELKTETVTDTLTQLTWQRGEAGNMPLDAAETYCRDLFLDGTGWRLPRKTELMSLAHRAGGWEMLKEKPALDRVAFPGARAVRYWATREGDEGPKIKGWVVDFATGGHDNLVQAGEGYAVRCVR